MNWEANMWRSDVEVDGEHYVYRIYKTVYLGGSRVYRAVVKVGDVDVYIGLFDGYYAAERGCLAHTRTLRAS